MRTFRHSAARGGPRVCCYFAAFLIAVSALTVSAGGASPRSSPLVSRPYSYTAYADAALRTMMTSFYNDAGWRLCPKTCRSVNRDWGADSLTYALYLRWTTTHDPSLVPTFAQLAGTAPSYPDSPKCTGWIKALCTWSDMPNWDAVAMLREYEVLHAQTFRHDVRAAEQASAVLQRAVAAFDTVQKSSDFSKGACPEIRYQQPDGYFYHLKTLETDATAIKAAALLYRFTGVREYLGIAAARYQGVRRSPFFIPSLSLYTVFVFDHSGRCRAEPQRLFASVNGEMISDGLLLYRFTGDKTYLEQALATAHAVDEKLNDASGIFVDFAGDNDIVEPLVEAMYVLATSEHERFAREWILRNANAAASELKTDGTYGRFFNGPPSPGTSTAWQTNGGFAIMFAAAALAPSTSPGPPTWTDVRFVPRHISLSLFYHTPQAGTVRFVGSGFALIGTLGRPVFQLGHVSVRIDGHETIDHTGVWQGGTSLGVEIPNNVLFAWQWPCVGPHTITFGKTDFNMKEGPVYLDAAGYYVRENDPGDAAACRR